MITTTIDKATCGPEEDGINLETICKRKILAINIREMISTCNGVIKNIV